MLDYPGVVDEAYLEKHGSGDQDTLSSVQKINMRFDVAKALFIKKYSKMDDQHNEELNQWDLILEDISVTENVSE